MNTCPHGKSPGKACSICAFDQLCAALGQPTAHAIYNLIQASIDDERDAESENDGL